METNNNNINMINKDNIDSIHNINSIEPKIITNTYYDNYSSKNNKKIDNFKTNKDHNYFSNNINESKTNNLKIFLKKLLVLSNIEGNFVRLFGIDKLWIPFLIKKIYFQLNFYHMFILYFYWDSLLFLKKILIGLHGESFYYYLLLFLF